MFHNLFFKRLPFLYPLELKCYPAWNLFQYNQGWEKDENKLVMSCELLKLADGHVR